MQVGLAKRNPTIPIRTAFSLVKWRIEGDFPNLNADWEGRGRLGGM